MFSLGSLDYAIMSRAGARTDKLGLDDDEEDALDDADTF